jgi:hypothetical protein
MPSKTGCLALVLKSFSIPFDTLVYLFGKKPLAGSEILSLDHNRFPEIRKVGGFSGWQLELRM